MLEKKRMWMKQEICNWIKYFDELVTVVFVNFCTSSGLPNRNLFSRNINICMFYRCRFSLENLSAFLPTKGLPHSEFLSCFSESPSDGCFVLICYFIILFETAFFSFHRIIAPASMNPFDHRRYESNFYNHAWVGCLRIDFVENNFSVCVCVSLSTWRSLGICQS